MTPATRYLVLAAALFTLAQIALAVWNARLARKYRQVAKFERIRCQFGVARNQLIWLAAQGKLRPDSVTFQRLYIVQSRMMRVFDAYPQVSHSMWSQALDGKLSADGAMARESRDWDDETKAVVSATADALHRVGPRMRRR